MSEAALTKVHNDIRSLKYPDKKRFWSERFDEKKGWVYTMIAPKIIDLLSKEGFAWHKDTLVKVDDHIVSETSKEEVYRYCNSYIKEFENAELESSWIKQGEVLIIKNKAVLLGLNELESEFLKDTITASYIPFSNVVVKVKKLSEIELIDYSDINKLIWKSSIIQREFALLTDHEYEDKPSAFDLFTSKVTNCKEHTDSLISTLGYLLSNYKKESEAKAVILGDENLADTEKAQGRTGKGLIGKSLGKIRPRVVSNAKNTKYAGEDKFVFGSVKSQDDILQIDDVHPGFSIEDFFSVITEDMVVEKKYRDKEVIPFKESPKILITTNYELRGNDASHRGRRHDIYLNNHYSDTFSPYNDFGCEFFTDWDKSEWIRFDNFMIRCLRFFLSMGLLSYESKEIKLKKLKCQTNADFWEYMQEEKNEFKKRYYKNDLKAELEDAYGTKIKKLLENHKILKTWIKIYADHYGYKLVEGRSGPGTWFEFEAEVDEKGVNELEF